MRAQSTHPRLLDLSRQVFGNKFEKILKPEAPTPHHILITITSLQNPTCLYNGSLLQKTHRPLPTTRIWARYV
jgi:hypothetical protein